MGVECRVGGDKRRTNENPAAAKLARALSRNRLTRCDFPVAGGELMRATAKRTRVAPASEKRTATHARRHSATGQRNWLVNNAKPIYRSLI